MRAGPVAAGMILAFVGAAARAEAPPVSIAASRLGLSRELRGARVPALDPVLLEVGVTSWAPRSLDAASPFGASELTGRQVKVPGFFVQAVFPDFARPDVSAKLGLGALSVAQTGTMPVRSLPMTQSFDTELLFARAALEYAPVSLRRGRWNPYFSGGLLPVVGLFRSSGAESSPARAGLGYELGAGGRLHLGSGFELDLSAHSKWGRLSGADLKGFGLEAAFGVSL